MAVNYKWVYPENKEIPSCLIDITGSRIIAQLLLNRGIKTPEEARVFLEFDAKISSPDVFEHMEKAVARISSAIESEEHIVVYGDFDADGVNSTALLYKTLKYLNANVSYYIPDRSDEGHGLNSASICKLISAKKAKIIITVDCGISNLAEITLAKSLGTDVIVTDHHEPPEIYPPAFAIINPKTMEEDTDLKYLAGVGVAYKLACALLESHGKSEFADDIIHLVAIGSIADVVPLLGENRALVAKGLQMISRKRPAGVIKLLESANFKPDSVVSSDMIAFGIAPRINAIGRLAEASLAVELLVSEDPEEIDLIVKKLNYNNRIRQQMCESTFIEANQKVNREIDLENDKAIVLADENWHPGIIGIVASKLVEKYHKPAFLISIDKDTNEARCSARSIEGLNLFETLEAHAELFNRFGGHALAAGFSLDLNKISFEKFRSLLNSTVGRKFDPSALDPKINIDMDLSSEDVSVELVDEISRLSPFGDSNPAPVFSISNLVLKQFKTMGSNNNHLKIYLSDDNDNILEAVWWQKNTLEASVLDRINIAFSAEVNAYAGRRNLQLVVKDIKPVNQKVENVLSFQKVNVTEQSAKWLDHRAKTSLEKAISNYLKTAKSTAVVFAESMETIKNIEKEPELKSRLINRMDIQKADQLMLFDLPPDLTNLSELVSKTEANIVHLIGRDFAGMNSGQLLKTLSGMLKYAYTNRNGEIQIEEIASKLSTSNQVIYEGLNLLNSVNVIKISNKTRNSVKYEFIGSVDLSSIVNLDEYYSFCNALDAVETFRQQLATDEIGSIKNLVNKFNSELLNV